MEDIDRGHFERTKEPFDDPRIGKAGRAVKRAGPWVKIEYEDSDLEPRWWHESWLYYAKPGEG